MGKTRRTPGKFRTRAAARGEALDAIRLGECEWRGSPRLLGWAERRREVAEFARDRAFAKGRAARIDAPAIDFRETKEG